MTKFSRECRTARWMISTSLATLLLAAPSVIPAEAASYKQAEVTTQGIDNVSTWDGAGNNGSWGPNFGIQTFGQVITAPGTNTTLNGFDFYLQAQRYDGSVLFKAYVYEWDANTNKMIGAPLYQSGTMSLGDSGNWETVSVTSTDVAMAADKQYLLFFSTATEAQSTDTYFNWGESGYTYADGGVAVTHSTDLSNPSAVTWVTFDFDVVFQAYFKSLIAAGGDNAPGLFRPTTRMMNDFLAISLNPFTSARGSYGARFATAQLGYADDTSVLSDDEKDAFVAVGTHGDAPREVKPWNVWGSAYGGYSALDGKAGDAGSQSRGYGMAAGVDYWLSADTMFGAALGIGQASWEMGAGNGAGNGDIYQLGVYARHDFGGLYLGGSLSAAYQAMETVRTSGTATLRADYDATNIGGRVEAGYAVETSAVTFTPYGAFQLQQLSTPDYSETGDASLAVSFASNNAVSSRGELGVMLEKAVGLSEGKDLKLFGKLALAHDFKADATLSASYSGGTSFLVSGDAGPANQALISAGAELQLDNGWSASATFDGEFAARSQSYAASGRVAYSW